MLVEFKHRVGDKIALRGATHTNPMQIGVLKCEPFMKKTGTRQMRFIIVEIDGREFEVPINRIINESYILKNLGVYYEEKR